jgi:hypothetical protein
VADEEKCDLSRALIDIKISDVFRLAKPAEELARAITVGTGQISCRDLDASSFGQTGKLTLRPTRRLHVSMR